MNAHARFLTGASALLLLLAVGAPGADARAAEGLGTWSVVAKMTTGRTEVNADVIGGKIYVVGGEALGREDSPLLQAFDPATKKWRDLAPLPTGASHVGVAALGGKIYAAGGFTANVHKNPLDQFLAYDPKTNKWTSLAPLPAPLGSVSLVALGGKIHAVGGRGPDGKVVDTHGVYDPKTNTWSMAAPLPTARDHLGLVVANGKIYAVAGRTVNTVANVGLVDVYDPATGKWSSAAEMPTPRSSGAAVTYRGLILYWGGECKDPKKRIAYDEFDGYDLKTNTWKHLAKAPTTMHAEAGAVVGGVAYFLGGSTSCGSDKPSQNVYAFRMR
jgi:N-acetylneuraminic acid mutarotase